MKKITIINTLLKIQVLLFCIVFFSSCEKNNVDEDGSSKLKVVNASPKASALSFTLAGTVLVNGGLNFTDASPYITTNSGSRLVAQFFNEGTTTLIQDGEIWLFRDLSYTVYLAGDVNSLRVKLFQDNLSSPDNGKARVNFIHLSDDAPSNINIKDGNDDNIITNLTRDTQSSYKDIATGTLSLKVYNTTNKDHVGDFSIPDLQAGKIYTVYFVSIPGTTTAHVVVHN